MPSSTLFDGSPDEKMSEESDHAFKTLSRQSDKDVQGLAQGRNKTGKGESSKDSNLPSERHDGEDPVVRAARLGALVERRSESSQDAPADNHQTSMVLYVDGDEHYLTEYQCLLRKQLEVFEAGPHDIRGSTQGRNVPILLGQVGLRCRHCANLPLAARTKGAVYYSQTVEG